MSALCFLQADLRHLSILNTEVKLISGDHKYSRVRHASVAFYVSYGHINNECFVTSAVQSAKNVMHFF